VFDGRSQPGGHQQGADFVSVQADGMRLVVQAGPADMHRRGHPEQPFFFGVAVEPGHRAQPSGHRGSSPPPLFQSTAVALHVRPSHQEQGDLMVLAPGNKLAQIKRL
jgi:hypothetical protein